MQRAAGFLSRQAFLAALAHSSCPSDEAAAWFADSLALPSLKNAKKGFLSIVYIKLPTSLEARSTSSKQKIEETV